MYWCMICQTPQLQTPGIGVSQTVSNKNINMKYKQSKNINTYTQKHTAEKSPTNATNVYVNVNQCDYETIGASYSEEAYEDAHWRL